MQSGEDTASRRTVHEAFATHHLEDEHANAFGGLLPAAHIEEVLEIWAEEVDDEDIVQPFLTGVVSLWDTLCSA